MNLKNEVFLEANLSKKKSDIFGQSDLLYRKAPEISLKLGGGGGWGSGIFSELHTRAKFLRFF